MHIAGTKGAETRAITNATDSITLTAIASSSVFTYRVDGAVLVDFLVDFFGADLIDFFMGILGNCNSTFLVNDMTTRGLQEVVALPSIRIVTKTVVNRGNFAAPKFLKEMRGLKCSNHGLGNHKCFCFTQRHGDVDV
jgi:hypothetical protein